MEADLSGPMRDRALTRVLLSLRQYLSSSGWLIFSKTVIWAKASAWPLKSALTCSLKTSGSVADNLAVPSKKAMWAISFFTVQSKKNVLVSQPASSSPDTMSSRASYSSFRSLQIFSTGKPPDSPSNLIMKKNEIPKFLPRTWQKKADRE